MAEADQISDLRDILGEAIPDGGDETDTLFSDEKIGKWVDRYSTNMDAAAYLGWRAKMAHFSNLVNVADGASSRALSDLFDHAEKMVAQYRRLAQGPAAGRTRIGKIVKPS